MVGKLKQALAGLTQHPDASKGGDAQQQAYEQDDHWPEPVAGMWY
jgi:hypothetical protein